MELIKPNGKPVLLYTLYRHPDSTPEPLKHLNASLQSISESSCCIDVGDFNLPNNNWSHDIASPIHNGGKTVCDIQGVPKKNGTRIN